MQEKNIEKLVEKYVYPRVHGEINLISEARRLMLEHGVGKSIVIFDNDPNIIFASDMNSGVQRFKLNTFLDTQYMSLRIDTSQERSMLLDSGSSSDWLKIFTDFHIPAMKSLGLPRSYQG